MKVANHKFYALKHVNIWHSDSVIDNACVIVENGIVKAIDQEENLTSLLAQVEIVVDGKGCDLLPMGTDPQVHMRIPGQPEKENIDTGSECAFKGGFAALLTMPNTNPVIDNVEVFNAIYKQVEEHKNNSIYNQSLKVLFSAAITKAQKGRELVEFDKLAQAGITAFTDDGVGVRDDDLMLAALQSCANVGVPLLQHAEVPGHGGVLAPSSVQAKLNIKPYSALAEVDMVKRDIALLKKCKTARYHVLHVSSKQTLEEVRKAKEAGLNITCEVSPHHLLYCGEDILESNTAFKMNPPLRSEQDRSFLRESLQNGLIDFVATDHAPHEQSSKGVNFKTAAFGTTGMEAALKVLLTLVADSKLSKARLVEVFCKYPALFLGLDEEYLNIQVGQKMQAILVDSKTKSTLTEQDLYSLSKNSCFIGANLNGSIKQHFIANQIVTD